MNDDDLQAALDDLVSPLPPLGALPARTAARVRRRRTAKLAGAGALAVVLVGGAAALAVPGQDRLVPAPRASAEPSAEPSVEPSVEPSPEPSCEVECGEQVRVVLQPDGLGVLTLPGGSNRMLLFGEATGAEVRTALAASLGDADEGPLPDCGAQVVVLQYAALTVVLDDEVLVGWSADADGPVLTTGDGIGGGDPLSDLQAAYPAVEVSDGSLGREFTVPGGYYGVLEDDAVLVLAAGNACFFR